VFDPLLRFPRTTRPEVIALVQLKQALPPPIPLGGLFSWLVDTPHWQLRAVCQQHGLSPGTRVECITRLYKHWCEAHRDGRRRFPRLAEPRRFPRIPARFPRC